MYKFNESNSKRLKILHIAGWYPSKKNPVAGIFVREHIKAISLYNDVVVLYSEGIDHRISGFYKVNNFIEDGIRTLRLRYHKSPIPKTSYFIYLWSMFAVFRKLLHEGWHPDVIHAHVYSAGVPAVLIGRHYKIPVVITEHFSGFLRGSVRGFEKLKAKFAFEQAGVVCPVSDDLKHHIEAYGIRTRFQVIPNVVNTSLFNPTEKDYTKKDSKKHLLLVALLDPKKGVPYLLKALAILIKKRHDFILDIVGDGPNRKEYEELSRKLQLEDIVYFHGLKTKPEVAEFMKQCDFFVQPTLYETFGVTFIEAMACGKPIVATNLPVLKEKINDKRGILVPPKDVNALSKAIDYMLDCYKDYSAEAIYEYANSNFSYEAVGKKFDNLYKEIINGKNDK